jgi:hypothetical protein
MKPNRIKERRIQVFAAMFQYEFEKAPDAIFCYTPIEEYLYVCPNGMLMKYSKRIEHSPKRPT